ncbi:MAG: hypothetical protein CL498_03965 [Actinobacteria bacterium]|nr:hypothetical protein [Actinomycetota bacterium]|tara:strand:+ start:12734 stop:12964 length:231 start_codon:yes stop_codon:yes gene_type:complete
MLTAKKIIKEIGHPHLNLYRGEGYQYFVYDNGKDGGDMVYGDYSVYVYRINDLSLDRWVSEGKDCIKQIEEEFAQC